MTGLKTILADTSYRRKQSNISPIELTSLTNPSALNGLEAGFNFEKMLNFFKSIGGIEGILKSFTTIRDLFRTLKELKPTIKSLVGPFINPEAAINVKADDDEIPDEGYLIFPRGRPKKKTRKRRSPMKKRVRMKKTINRRKRRKQASALLPALAY